MGVILSQVNVNMLSYTLPYKNELNEKINVLKNQNCEKFIIENYPILSFNICKKEILPTSDLKICSKDQKEGNNKLYAEFSSLIQPLKTDVIEFACKKTQKGSGENRQLITKNGFYNPIIINLLKKSFPEADSLVFALGYYTCNSLKIRSDAYEFGSIIPLKKGFQELEDGTLKVFLKNGGVQKFNIEYIPESLINIESLSIDKLEIDSIFISDKPYGQNSPAGNLIPQFPLYYKEIQIGIYENYKWDLDYNEMTYLYNDSTIIQLLPYYLSYQPTLTSYDRLWFNVDGINCSNIAFYQWPKDPRWDLETYAINMAKYFHYKKLGDVKKSNKYLVKADKSIEKFKSLYFK